MPLSAQVYKWVSVNLLLWVNRVMEIPFHQDIVVKCEVYKFRLDLPLASYTDFAYLFTVSKAAEAHWCFYRVQKAKLILQ